MDIYQTKLEEILKGWRESWKQSIGSRWKECYINDIPYNLSQEDISNLEQEFSKTWGIPITRIFTGLTPYRELIKLRKRHNTITPEFAQWYQIYSKVTKEKVSNRRVQKKYKDRFESIERSLKEKKPPINIREYKQMIEVIEDEIKKENILYTLVGQRAIIISLRELTSTGDTINWAKKTGVKLEKYKECLQEYYADILVETINGLNATAKRRNENIVFKSCIVKSGIKGLTKRFWAGSILKRDDDEQIDYSERASLRASKWIILMCYIALYKKCNTNSVFEKTIKEINRLGVALKSERINKESFGSDLLKAIKGLVGNKKGTNAGECPMAFLIGPVNEDWDWNIGAQAASDRITHLMNLIK